MSWNNIIPMELLECQMMCGTDVDKDGWILHVPECKIGQEIKERDARKQDSSKPDSEPRELGSS